MDENLSRDFLCHADGISGAVVFAVCLVIEISRPRRSGFRTGLFSVLLLSCVADAAVFFRRKRSEYVHANFSVTVIFCTGVRGILVMCLLDTLRQKLLFADDETSVECAQPSSSNVFVGCLSWIMHLSRIT